MRSYHYSIKSLFKEKFNGKAFKVKFQYILKITKTQYYQLVKLKIYMIYSFEENGFCE